MTFAARQHTQSAVGASGVVASAGYNSVGEGGSDPVVVSASITVEPDGRVLSGGILLGNWYAPTTGGVGSGYRVRFQVSGEPFTGLAANTFYALSSARTVTFSAGPDYTASAFLTIQIATSGSDTIIGTGTVYIYVENAYEA